MLRILIISLLWLIPLQTQAQVIVNLTNSVVMVDNNYACFSTAFGIHEDEDNYYLLTAGHTIDGWKNYTRSADYKCIVKRKSPLDLTTSKFDISLYHNGTQQKFDDVVKVVGHIYEDNPGSLKDLALLSVKKEDIKGYGKSLNILKLATRKSDTKVGRLIWTCGHPNAGWPSAYKGTIIEDKWTEAITFYPPSMSGRSGSPLMNYNGQKVLGVIVYTKAYPTKDGSMGVSTKSGAVPFWKIQEFLDQYEVLQGKDQNE